MEKEVVVAADVDQEEELSKVFKFVNLLWLHGLIDGETLESANKIKEHQGCHEHEVSVGGEVDLLRHYTRCQKNPGHSHFIPVRDFKIEHLPNEHRNNVIFDYIRAQADLTCRLRVECTSENRSEYHPNHEHSPYLTSEQSLYPFFRVSDGDFMRTGTGLVGNIRKFTEEDNISCQCEECSGPGTHTPKKVWGMIAIMTEKHVVFDDDEAKRTTCYFGYDTSTTLFRQCLKLKGLRSENVCTFSHMCSRPEDAYETDLCWVKCATHNMAIIKKLDKMTRRRDDLMTEVFSKYRTMMNTGWELPCPVVIISHPHGCSKHISVGRVTDKQTCGEPFVIEEFRWSNIMVKTKYIYDTDTCPGSSGAPVIGLPEAGRWWKLLTRHVHSHSEVLNINYNKSTIGIEYAAPPHRN